MRDAHSTKPQAHDDRLKSALEEIEEQAKRHGLKVVKDEDTEKTWI